MMKIYSIDEHAFAFVNEAGKVDLVTVGDGLGGADTAVIVYDWANITATDDEYIQSEELWEAAEASDWDLEKLDISLVAESEASAPDTEQDALNILYEVDAL